MDEVKIWAVDDDSNVVPLVSKGQTESESLLEETLVSNPDMLIPGLRLVGRQTPTEGGPLDLLGVDSDGRLVVFELKRGTLSRDAVAQIIDYSSYLDAMGLAELADYISDKSGAHGIERIGDFMSWHLEHTGAESLDTLRPMRLFLVGLGADDRTERMVRFLAENSEMDISLLTFHGFSYEGKTFLARQVEVEAAADPGQRRASRYVSAAERRERLTRRVEDSGVSEIFGAARDMFRGHWRGPVENVGTTALGFHLLEHALTGAGRRVQRGYARISPEQGRIRIIFYGRAANLCPDEFDQARQEIPFETWRPPSDPEGEYEETQFVLDSGAWETHKERLHALTQAVYEAWESRDQDDGT